MKWSDYPLLRLSFFLTLGIIVAEASAPYVSSVTVFAVSGAVLACMSWFMARAKATPNRKSGTYAFGVSAMAMAFLMGMFMYVVRYERMADCVRADSEIFKGAVVKVPQEKRRSWMIRVSGAKPYDVVLYVGKDSAHYDAQRCQMLSVREGDTVVAKGRYVRPMASDDSASKRYERMLLHSGVCATSYVRPYDIGIIRSDGKTAWRDVSPRLMQRRLHELYRDNDISGEAGDVIEAISIGRKSSLSAARRESYARAGVSHMLALSGFHVGIIMMLLQWVLMSRFMERRKSRVVNLMALLLLWGFVFVAGASASLVRAALMCTIVMVNALFSRVCSFINVCTLAYVAMLCVNPMSLYDVSFQLSFLAVAGIAIYNALMRGRMPSMPSCLRFIYDTVMICLVCTAFTVPMSAYHFGSVSVVCVVSNLLAVLLLYVIVIGTFLWWVTLCYAPLNGVMASLTTWAASTLNSIVDYMSSLPFAAVSWHPGKMSTLGSYLLLMVMVYIAKVLLEKRENA